MNRLPQNAVWLPWTAGMSRWLSYLKQQALRPCPIPIPVRVDHRRCARAEFAHVASSSGRSQERR